MVSVDKGGRLQRYEGSRGRHRSPQAAPKTSRLPQRERERQRGREEERNRGREKETLKYRLPDRPLGSGLLSAEECTGGSADPKCDQGSEFDMMDTFDFGVRSMRRFVRALLPLSLANRRLFWSPVYSPVENSSLRAAAITKKLIRVIWQRRRDGNEANSTAVVNALKQRR